ncbi:hypothetical protein KC19_VG057200 [Ceratodon purpureus]|uniref:Uncharacterized protein n=1 Tax=Ceratodon purpureus TaxID=3225 RepID=A0A8T0HMB7_CERPU|nr:hypothetical protein KC19_VG057200 [Ceratodon purpureus]
MGLGFVTCFFTCVALGRLHLGELLYDLRVYLSSMNVESCGCGYFGLSTCCLKCCVGIWEAGNNIQ